MTLFDEEMDEHLLGGLEAICVPGQIMPMPDPDSMLPTLPELRFTVFGEAKPAGSKTSGVAYKDGQPIEKNGKIVTFTKDSSGAPGKAWRQEVASAGQLARVGAPWGDRMLADVPLAVELTFFRPRKKGHYGSGRNSGVLLPSAPPAPHLRPDVLKLARAVEDALTTILWKDDAQIVDERLRKVWGEPERCEIVVRAL